MEQSPSLQKNISCLAVLGAIVVMDLNPGILLQINATSAQVGVLITSKSDKGLAIQRSHITLVHDILDTHETHITFTNRVCNLKTAILVQLMAIFALKMLPLILDTFVPVQHLEKHSHQHQIILSCTLNHTQFMH